jgi:hypothetical protein
VAKARIIVVDDEPDLRCALHRTASHPPDRGRLAEDAELLILDVKLSRGASAPSASCRS